MKHNNFLPTIGSWYKNQSGFEGIFEVVAKDDEQDLIEIQYFDGEIGELELRTWKELPIIEVAEPEDWSGAYELSQEDLLEYKSEIIHPIRRNNPLDFI
jgi:hypothetical protein